MVKGSQDKTQSFKKLDNWSSFDKELQVVILFNIPNLHGPFLTPTDYLLMNKLVDHVSFDIFMA